MAKLCKGIGTLLLALVIVVGLLMFLPSLFGKELFNVVSGSMEPEIPVGSLIMVQYEEPKTIEEGEVIAFEHQGSVVTHRVVQNDIPKASLITKGDANTQEDFEPVSYGQVIGVVQFHVAALGAIFGALSTINGKIFLIALAVVGALLNVLGQKLQH